MIYIETDKNDRVTTQIMKPFDKKHGVLDLDGNVKTEEQMLANGFLVDGMFEPEIKDGMASKTYYTKEKGFWAEYEIYTDPNDKIAKIQSDLDYLILKQEGLI